MRVTPVGLAIGSVLLAALSVPMPAVAASTFTGVVVAGDPFLTHAESGPTHPDGIAIDSAGAVYVVDGQNGRVIERAKKSDPWTTVVGADPSSARPELLFPSGITVDADHNIFVVDTTFNEILQYAPGSTAPTRAVGSGFAGSSLADLNRPTQVALDSAHNFYVLDSGNNRVVRWAPNAMSGTQVSFTYSIGSGAAQPLSSPTAIAVGPQGDLYVADGCVVVKWHPGDASAAVVAGSGTCGAGPAQLAMPTSLAVASDGSVFVGEQSNYRVSKWTPGATTGIVAAGDGTQGSGVSQLNYVDSIALDAQDNLFVTDIYNSRITEWPNVGGSPVVYSSNTGDYQLTEPSGLSVDGAGNLYVSDYWTNRVMKWPYGATSGQLVAGTGVPGKDLSQLSGPIGLTTDAAGNVFVSDYLNNRAVKWAPSAGAGVVVAGADGFGSSLSQLEGAEAIAVDSKGNTYVCDTWGNRVLKFAPGARTGTLIAGTGTAGDGLNQLWNPMGIALDTAGNLYVADFSNSRVMKWVPGAQSGTVVDAFSNLDNSGTRFSPQWIAVDPAGDIYVTDTNDHSVVESAVGQPYAVTIIKAYEAVHPKETMSLDALAVGSDGTIYVGDQINHYVAAFNAGPRAPSLPLHLQATPGNQAVRLTWDPPATTGGGPITSYDATLEPGSHACTIDATQSSATTCLFTGLTNGTAYTATVTASNSTKTSGAATLNVAVVPQIPPPPLSDTPGITINAATKFTHLADVVLGVTWPAGSVTMSISNDAAFTQPTEVPVAATQNWTLPSPSSSQPAHVYVRFHGVDLSDVQSQAVYSATITYDATPPVIAAASAVATTAQPDLALALSRLSDRVRAVANPASRRVIHISVQASDGFTGLAHLQVAGGPSGISGPTASYRPSFNLSLPASLKSIRLRVQDRAGNWSTWKVATIK
jgi:sugar lactone lactonase YvrE